MKNNVKKEFYNLLQQVKFDIEYYKLYTVKYKKYDFILKVLIAVCSTGCFGSIIIYRQLNITLSSVIFLFLQIFSVFKDNLLWSSWVSELLELVKDYENMFLQMEEYYRDINKSTEKSIIEAISKYKDKVQVLQHNCMKGEILPIDEKIKIKANDITNDYFDSEYGGINLMKGKNDSKKTKKPVKDNLTISNNTQNKKDKLKKDSNSIGKKKATITKKVIAAKNAVAKTPSSKKLNKLQKNGYAPTPDKPRK